MARILFSTVSGAPNQQLPCLYEGFINALLREGNDVMLMITNQFIDNCWDSNYLKPYLNKSMLDRAIKEFNPELVISFNNSLYEKIPKIVDCPIAAWGTDTAPIFAGKRDLKKNISRYHIICSTEELYPSMIEYFNIKKDKLYTVQFATDFAAENLEQKFNISFIGTNFCHTNKIKECLITNSKEDFKKLLEAHKKNVLKKPDILLKQLHIKNVLVKSIPHSDLLNLLSSNFRTQTLANICDLGLELYGTDNWHDVINYSLDLALAYNPKKINSVKENQAIYNKSKIAINITHAQAGKAFGWRVRDIMATNACLVSDYREDLTRLFGKYVTIPTFQSPLEAKDVCKKLLKDDMWRNEITQASQIAIEENHRFKHRLKELEGIFNIKLFNNTTGTLTQLAANDFINNEISRLKLENESLKFYLIMYKNHASTVHMLYSKALKYCPTWAYKFIKKAVLLINKKNNSVI